MSLLFFQLEDFPMATKPTCEELEQKVKELEDEISEQKGAKQESKDCPRLLQEVIDNIKGEVFIKDTNGKYLFVNNAYEKDFGVDKNEVIGKDDFFVFSPEVAKKLQENDKRIMESKIAETVEESGEVKGKIVTYRTNKVPLIDEDGEVYGICGIGFDITQQKRLEEALWKSENEMRIVTNNVPALIAYVDKEQVYRFTNRGYQEAVRHSQEEIKGRTIKEILGEKGYEMIQHHIEKALSGQRIEFETLMPFEDDHVRYMNATYVPYLKEGTVEGFFALIVDITERKQNEKALHQSEERLSLAAETANLGIWEWRFDTGEVYDSREKFLEISGLTREEARNFSPDLWLSKVHPDDKKRTEEKLQALFIGETERAENELRVRHPKKGWIWLYGVGLVVERDKYGKPIRIVGVHRDITDRKHAEEEREKLINELQGALKEIKTLRGILPLCSFCKKIRDDKGYWEQVDVYIHKHLQADISHSVCPECAKEHYPDLDIYDD